MHQPIALILNYMHQLPLPHQLMVDIEELLANTSAAAAISSWGTGANPWIFKVKTATNVPNFSTTG
jgi:hypothetical protein